MEHPIWPRTGDAPCRTLRRSGRSGKTSSARFAWAFTRRGFRRFAEWITAMALNVEEHTVTQSVLALDRPADWKAMESFAEYGAWRADYVTCGLTRLVERAPGSIWHGFRIWSVDDTKVHRGDPHVWGTCTFHEYTARCPNRATTVRAHNWVALGALLENPGKPAWYLPISGRLYFRESQLPPRSGMAGPTVEFRTKCELAVELIREQARLRPRAAPGHLRRRLRPPQRRAAAGPPRRRRPADRVPHPAAARRPALRPAADGAAQGQARAASRYGARSCRRRGKGAAGPGRGTPAWPIIYGRLRQVRWKEVVCLWRVLGHEAPVKAVVACVEGYKKRFTLVTSAVGLSGLQMVELFAARFRQEDGFRDLKQRLGWEECRAWTRNPIERTSQAQWVALSLMRLAQFRLESAGEGGLVVAAAVEQGQGPAQRARC